MKKIKNIIAMIVILLNGIIVSNAIDDESKYGYYIKNLDVKIEINSKKEYKVTETIDVYFNKEMRGIKRRIPKHAKTSSGMLNYRIKDITINGLPYKISNSRKGGFVYIKVRDEEKAVIGDKRYILEYTIVNRKDKKDDEYNEYANVSILDEGWNTYIEKLKVTIECPEKAVVLNNYKDVHIDDIDLFEKDKDYENLGDDNLISYINYGDKIVLESNGVLERFSSAILNLSFKKGTFSDMPKMSLTGLIISIIMVLWCITRIIKDLVRDIIKYREKHSRKN